VVPNLFASTEPGDLFVVRNVGNIVSPCHADGTSTADRSEGAAVEFALEVLGVRDVVVCGHSECGAMRALLSDQLPNGAPNLVEWLDVGRSSLRRFAESPRFGSGLEPHNRLSQLNVLQQLENLRTYPVVQRRLAAGTLRMHAWWFDLAQAEVLAYNVDDDRFGPITKRESEGLPV
jgi:carbonic anhydrase